MLRRYGGSAGERASQMIVKIFNVHVGECPTGLRIVAQAALQPFMGEYIGGFVGRADVIGNLHVALTIAHRTTGVCSLRVD